ncbi:MAG TPA: hypothetical protein VD931_18090 [Baekduia sp.]|nr:hypothetical protein [Baekduia sp.]
MTLERLLRWFVAAPQEGGPAREPAGAVCAAPLPVAPAPVGVGAGSRGWAGPSAEPADPARRTRCVVALVRPGDAALCGAALGLALVAGGGAAAVLTWRPGAAPGAVVADRDAGPSTGRWDEPHVHDAPEPARHDAAALATRAAARLARRLEGQGLATVARGRIVLADLPADAAAAERDANRALALDAPAVLVVAGPRPPSFDALLAGADRVVVATAPETPGVLVELALADAARAARATGRLELRPSAANAVALAGLGTPPALRRAVVAALGGEA